MIEVKNLGFRYDRDPVLRDVSFEMHEGEFVCILGANGCGKTTLLRSILGFLKPQQGQVLLYGKSILTMPERELARQLAYIPQSHIPPFPFTVTDVVLMGRTPHMTRSYSPSPEDRAIAEEALEKMGITALSGRTYTELSGGQRQLVIIARAIAQQTSILIMDEPTASLDFGNQYLVLSQMLRLSEEGKSILMVTHNPDHALYCADRVIALQGGTVLKDGKADEVVTEENLRRIYRIDVKVRNVELEEQKNVTVCIPQHTRNDRGME